MTNKEVEKQLKGSPVVNFVNRYKCKDGSYKTLEWQATFVKEGIVHATARDITERKKTEVGLLESNNILAKAQQIAHIGSWTWDIETDKVTWSDELFNIHGLDKQKDGDSLTAELIQRMSHPDDMDRVLQNAQTALKTGKVDSIEYRIIRPDKTERVVYGESELSFSLTKNKPGRMIGIVQDITERKQIEEDFRKEKDLLSVVMENTGTMLVYLDKDFNFIRVNEVYAKTCKYQPEEMVGKNHFDLYPHEENQAIFARVRDTGQPETYYNKPFTFPDQPERGVTYWDWTLSPVKDAKDNVNRLIFSLVETTKNVMLQQELIQSSRLASVGEMAAGIAHEINNPLTGVVGFSDLLLKKDLPDDIMKDVNVINEGARRISDITRRMLAFARQKKPERNSVNINDIIEVVLAMRAYEMKSSNIKVATQLASDIPLTFADAGQLQQAFLNIVLNAEMEMGLVRGKGNLSIKTERIDNAIRISFKDDGPGILKNNMDRLFDPFFTTRDPDKGTGLGLSICYSIVTQHGGKIYARSRLGKGATFFVELPIVTKEEQLKMAEPAAEVPKTLSRARILVVDDDTIVQQFLTKVLDEKGHEVEIVENGDDALERIKSEDYDVILLDIKLPGMSGIELYKYMQKAVKSLARKVIFITGDTMSKDTTDFLAKTRAPYITKPFDAEQLKKEINHILSQQA